MSSHLFLLSIAICVLLVCACTEWSYGAYIGRNPYGKPYERATDNRGAPKYNKMTGYKGDADKRFVDEEPTEARPTLRGNPIQEPEDNSRLILA